MNYRDRDRDKTIDRENINNDSRYFHYETHPHLLQQQQLQQQQLQQQQQQQQSNNLADPRLNSSNNSILNNSSGGIKNDIRNLNSFTIDTKVHEYSEKTQYVQAENNYIKEWLIEQSQIDLFEYQEPFILTKYLNYLQDKDHIWCQHFTIGEKIFEYMLYDIALKDYKNKVRTQLSMCTDCVLQYINSKRRQIKLLSFDYDVESIVKIVDDYDSKRILDNLSLYENEPNKMGPSLIEVLLSPNLLSNQTLKNKMFLVLQNKLLAFYIKDIVGDCRTPGIYPILMGKLDSLKKWIFDCIQEYRQKNGPIKIETEYLRSFDQIFINLIDVLIKYQDSQSISNSIFSDNIDDIYLGFPFFIDQFDQNTLTNCLYQNPILLKLVFNELKKTKKQKIIGYLLKSIEIIFINLQVNIWKYVDGFNSKNYLEIILYLLSKNYKNDEYFFLLNRLKDSILEYSDEDTNKTLNEMILNFYIKLVTENFKSLSVQIKDYCINYFITKINSKASFQSLELIGKRLVLYILDKNMKSNSSYNNLNYNLYITFLKRVLFDSTIEIRNQYQFIINSTEENEIIKVINDKCEYWPSSIWCTLLLLNPSNIPTEIHQTILNTHRILSLVNVDYLPKKKKIEYLNSNLYKSLVEYQDLMYQYLTMMTTHFNTISVSGGILDSVQFEISIFSFLVSPSIKITEIFKKLLLKKYPVDFVISSFSNAILKSPEKTIQGIICIIRDLFINYGVLNCLDSINTIFYYCGHLFDLFKKEDSLKSSTKSLLLPLIDIVWPLIDYLLSKYKLTNNNSDYQEEYFSNSGNSDNSFKNGDEIKYLFIFLKESFSFFSQSVYCSHKEPLPSFFVSLINKDSYMFSSSQQYPKYIRESLKMNNFYNPNSEEQFLHALELYSSDNVNFYYENSNNDTLEVNDESFSIISNYNSWIKNLLNWKFLGIKSEWFESLVSILQSLVDKQFIDDSGLSILQKISNSNNYSMNQFISIIDSVQQSITEKKRLYIDQQFLNNFLCSSNNSKNSNDDESDNSSNKRRSMEPDNNYNNKKFKLDQHNINNNSSPIILDQVNNNSSPINNNQSSPILHNTINSYNSSPNIIANSINNLNNSPTISDLNNNLSNISPPINSVPSSTTISVTTINNNSPNNTTTPISSPSLSNKNNNSAPSPVNIVTNIPTTHPTNLTTNTNNISSNTQLNNTNQNTTPPTAKTNTSILLANKANLESDEIESYDIEPSGIDASEMEIENESKKNDIMIPINLSTSTNNIIMDYQHITFQNFTKLLKNKRSWFQDLSKLYDPTTSPTIISINNQKYQIKESFANHDEYIDYYEPILWERLKERIIKCSNDSIELKISLVSCENPNIIHFKGSNNSRAIDFEGIENRSLLIIRSDLTTNFQFFGVVCDINIENRYIKMELFIDSNEVEKNSMNGDIYTIKVVAPLNEYYKAYNSLYTINKTRLFKTIITPFNSKQDNTKTLINMNKVFIEKLSHYLDPDQYTSINPSSMLTDGINLISGYGGCGKTSLIIPLISIYALYSKTRIVVCLYSKSAVDELTETILKDGLYDKDYNRAKVAFLQKKGFNGDYDIFSFAKASILICTTNEAMDLSTQPSKENVTLIIDDSTKSFELFGIFPLFFNTNKLVLIGNCSSYPNDLNLSPIIDDTSGLASASIINTERQAYLNQSLFHRLKKLGFPITYLTIQHRTSSFITPFIESEFYSFKKQELKSFKDHTKISAISNDYKLGPLIFYDISYSDGIIHSPFTSYYESRTISCILQIMGETIPKSLNFSVGIITPFRKQVNSIKENLNNEILKNYNIEIGTIDEFVGKEKDIIIYSCCKNPHINYNYFPCSNDMIIPFSSSKISTIIVGHSTSLCALSIWRHFQKYIKTNISKSIFKISSTAIEKGQLLQIESNGKDRDSNSSISKSSRDKSISRSDCEKTKQKERERIERERIEREKLDFRPPERLERNKDKDRLYFDRDLDIDVREIKTKSTIDSSFSPSDLRIVIENTKTGNK